MRNLILQAIQDRDTLGGIIEVIVFNLPPGLGSYVHWDRRLDARLGAAILSIPAIKGVEIGTAFVNSTKRGTQVQDAIYLENDHLIRKTNHAGGLEGGVSTGQPILLRAAMKPIPTTLTPQKSVDISLGKEVLTQYERSDTCPVPRAIVIIEAMVAFVMADALIEKLGGDSLGEMLPRYSNLRGNRLTDITLDKDEHLWWSS
jgi:chorismate synthase